MSRQKIHRLDSFYIEKNKKGSLLCAQLTCVKTKDTEFETRNSEKKLRKLSKQNIDYDEGDTLYS